MRTLSFRATAYYHAKWLIQKCGLEIKTVAADDPMSPTLFFNCMSLVNVSCSNKIMTWNGAVRSVVLCSSSLLTLYGVVVRLDTCTWTGPFTVWHLWVTKRGYLQHAFLSRARLFCSSPNLPMKNAGCVPGADIYSVGWSSSCMPTLGTWHIYRHRSAQYNPLIPFFASHQKQGQLTLNEDYVPHPDSPMVGELDFASTLRSS